jgi:hypothetical protein
MSEFVYLYRGAQAGAGSPEQAQKHMQKWMTWLKDLADQGHIKDMGQPLDRTGKIVRREPRSVTDGPFAEKDIVGGYTLVIAKDINEAVELSLGCPVFDNGGFVEVRPIMKM